MVANIISRGWSQSKIAQEGYSLMNDGTTRLKEKGRENFPISQNSNRKNIPVIRIDKKDQKETETREYVDSNGCMEGI